MVTKPPYNRLIINTNIHNLQVWVQSKQKYWQLLWKTYAKIYNKLF